MTQHDTLTQALQDAASSLETISRLAGKAAHPNGDETCMGTFPEVRGYATSRAEVARAALSATQPAQAAQGGPAEHWHRLYLEKCQQYNDRVAQLGGVIEGLEAEAAQGAGEVVYQYQNADGSWIDQQKSSYDYNVRYGAANVRVLYTQPAAGADVLDAERYRFLAERCRSASEHWRGRWWIVIDGPAPKSHDSEDDFDDAIDAAIAASGRQE